MHLLYKHKSTLRTARTAETKLTQRSETLLSGCIPHASKTSANVNTEHNAPNSEFELLSAEIDHFDFQIDAHGRSICAILELA